jgi:hypothetical protein
MPVLQALLAFLLPNLYIRGLGDRGFISSRLCEMEFDFTTLLCAQFGLMNPKLGTCRLTSAGRDDAGPQVAEGGLYLAGADTIANDAAATVATVGSLQECELLAGDACVDSRPNLAPRGNMGAFSTISAPAGDTGVFGAISGPASDMVVYSRPRLVRRRRYGYIHFVRSHHPSSFNSPRSGKQKRRASQEPAVRRYASSKP